MWDDGRKGWIHPFINERIFSALMTWVHFLLAVFNWQSCCFYLKQRRRLINHANAKSKSEKFPPPHQDCALGYPLGSSHHIDPALIPNDVLFSTTSFTYSKEPIQTCSGPLVDPAGVGASRRKKNAGDTREPSKLPTGKDKSRDTRLKGKKSMAWKL